MLPCGFCVFLWIYNQSDQKSALAKYTAYIYAKPDVGQRLKYIAVERWHLRVAGTTCRPTWARLTTVSVFYRPAIVNDGQISSVTFGFQQHRNTNSWRGVGRTRHRQAVVNESLQNGGHTGRNPVKTCAGRRLEETGRCSHRQGRQADQERTRQAISVAVEDDSASG